MAATVRRCLQQSFLLFLVVGLATSARATMPPPAPSSATQAQRQCQRDADCSLVPIGCTCCGGSGHHEAVNHSAASAFSAYAGCSAGEKLECARRNCVMVKTPIARCAQNLCTVTYEDMK